MGRKIPARKHRTVKDPNVQRANRFAKIKNKINNPPKKDDFQEVPKSVLRIMELKEKAKNIAQSKKKKKGDDVRKKKNKEIFDVKRALGREVKMPGMDKPDKYIPPMEQGPSETPGHFIGRVKDVCDEVIKEFKFEQEFKVEVIRDSEGVITDVQRIKAKKRSKKPKLAEKRKERENKKVNAKEPILEFPKRETFEFGDIVHAPPKVLTTPGPKKNNESDVIPLKPGNRDLLLKKALGDGGKAASPKITKIEKERQEERRKLVVDAFRKSKKQRNI